MTHRPVAVTVAPNGSTRQKTDHPALPVTPGELARCASACREAGAAMFHLHVRDREGRHLLDADAYREATRAIRTAVGPDMVIQATSEAAGRYGPAEQMAVIRDTQPEAVSVALREIVRSDADLPAASTFMDDLDRAGTFVQIILYSDADLAAYRDLRRRGALGSRPQALLFVLGRYTPGQVSAPADLLPFLREPAHEPFAVCAFGPAERDCVLASALLGGDIRIGFENNIAMPDGTRAPNNEALVGCVVDGLRDLGRRPASSDELRRRYG